MILGIQNNLFSTNQFIKTKHITIFDKEEVNIYDATNTEIRTTKGTVLRGWRLPDEGLWRIPLDDNATAESNINTKTVKAKETPSSRLKIQPPPLSQSINNVYKLKVKPEMVRNYHAVAGFPTKPSWIAAINNKHYSSWPGLDATAVAKYFPESDEMCKQHGCKIKSGLRSTKKLVATEIFDEVSIETKEKEKVVYAKEYNFHSKLDCKIYSDQTGKFPVTSFCGNKYIMVLFELDSNSILSEPTRNRTAGEMIRSYQKWIDRLREKGIQPKLHLLDNE